MNDKIDIQDESYRSVKITGVGPRADQHQVFLDGHDVSGCISRVEVIIEAGKKDKIILHAIPRIEISDELMAKVKIVYGDEAS